MKPYTLEWWMNLEWLSRVLGQQQYDLLEYTPTLEAWNIRFKEAQRYDDLNEWIRERMISKYGEKKQDNPYLYKAKVITR